MFIELFRRLKNNSSVKNKMKTLSTSLASDDLSNYELGKKGEEFASLYLQSLGYQILHKNYKFGKYEADIIAKDGEYIVFIEVKTRRNFHYGVPAEAVTQEKQRHYKIIAPAYIKHFNYYDKFVRFDVVEIIKGKPHLIQNAFI